MRHLRTFRIASKAIFPSFLSWSRMLLLQKPIFQRNDIFSLGGFFNGIFVDPVLFHQSPKGGPRNPQYLRCISKMAVCLMKGIYNHPCLHFIKSSNFRPLKILIRTLIQIVSNRGVCLLFPFGFLDIVNDYTVIVAGTTRIVLFRLC